MKSSYDILILGAGAAGLMAAATAAKRGRNVLLLDHADKLAEKIRISGGGRCNFTNRDIKPESYISANPHFCRSALAQYTQYDFIALLKEYGIRWHEKTLGQLFCIDSAKDIIAMLDQECQKAGVKRMMRTEISAVYYKEERFFIETSRGNFNAEALIVATGGLALPEVGATPFGYKIAERFGIPIVPPIPALVPLALHKEDLERFAPLAGISLEVEARIGKTAFREKMLFTHKGISGPAVLQISSYWTPGQQIIFNLLPGQDIEAVLQENASSDKKLSSLLTELGWPKRFTDTWLSTQGVQDIRLRELSDKKRRQLAEILQNWPLLPNGTQGYKFAEATRGGVDTHALDSKTMSTKIMPKLFFAGEVIDVTGWLGGYNFQWAWSSGYVAGMNA